MTGGKKHKETKGDKTKKELYTTALRLFGKKDMRMYLSVK